MSSRRIGIIQIVLSGFLFSFIGVIGKLAIKRQILPLELLSLRFIISCTILILGFLIFNRSLFKASIKNIFIFCALGTFGYAMMALSFMKSLEVISSSMTVLLLYLYPVIVALLGHAFLNERISTKKIIYFVMAFVGLALLVLGEVNLSDLSHTYWGISSAIFYSLYIVLSKVSVKNTPALTAIFYIQLSAAFTTYFISHGSVERFKEVAQSSYGLILFFALVSTIGAMVLFMAGLKKIKSWEASILSLSEPLFGVLVSVIVLSEELSLQKMIGAIIVLVSLVLISLPPRSIMPPGID